MKSSQSIILQLGFPYALVYSLVAIHAGACGLLLVLPWALALKLFFVALLLVNLFIVLRKLPGLSRPENIQVVEWGGDGSWFIKTFTGKQLAVQLQPSSFVHPCLVVLNFRLADEKRLRSVALFPGGMDRETLRRLRVRLLIEGCAETAG